MLAKSHLRKDSMNWDCYTSLNSAKDLKKLQFPVLQVLEMRFLKPRFLARTQFISDMALNHIDLNDFTNL